jgi:hypothetical protein
MVENGLHDVFTVFQISLETNRSGYMKISTAY